MRLSVIAPTYNEAANIFPFVEKISSALVGIEHEILIVDDDSPDDTWLVAQNIARVNPRVRVIRRLQNRGLGLAVIDGFSSALGDVIACIDADLQHDPKILPQMLAALENGCDIVVGSRYANGGGTGNWNRLRRLESWIATKMAQTLLGVAVKDPMSGYFLMRRSDFDSVRGQLNAAGFKILLEIIAELKPEEIREVPYEFRSRVAGNSKLSTSVVFEYLGQLWRLSKGRRGWLDRFWKFGLVGASGVFVNLVILAVLLKTFGLRDWRASALANITASISNYLINNLWTFSDRAHRRWQIVRGYLSYLLMSAAGLVVSTMAYAGLTWLLNRYPLDHNTSISGKIILLCQLASIAVGALLNYELNASVTWPVVVRALAHPIGLSSTLIGESVRSAESLQEPVIRCDGGCAAATHSLGQERDKPAWG